MEALCKASALFPPFHSIPTNSSSSPHLHRLPKTFCLRIDGKEKVPSEEPNVPSTKSDLPGSDVWKLFSHAQRNITHINKQRLVAMKEVKRLKVENETLLENLEQLETEMKRTLIELQGRNSAGAPSLSLCELLLRIDSMVISGLLSKGDASELRKKFMESKVAIHDALGDIHHKTDGQLLSELHKISEKITKKPLHIVHICSEMDPVASYGPLATYVTGLSSALQRRGNFVEVILPKYSNINIGMIQGLSRVEAEFESYFGGQWHNNAAWIGSYKGVGIIMIEPLQYSAFFSRERSHGYSDDFERFLYFSRASMDYIVKSGKQPDVLHIHNWETAVVGPLFWDIFVHQACLIKEVQFVKKKRRQDNCALFVNGLDSTRILLTCQDFGSQCLEQPNKLELCGLDPHKLHRPDRLQNNDDTNLINILKGGIVYSNKVVVMSTIHSRERIIHSLSCGLEPTLAIHKEKLMVAPYGIDAQQWDPSRDKYIPRTYSTHDMDGKTACREALIQRLSLSRRISVVVGCIFHGKSEIDVKNLKIALQNGTRQGAQFVLMDCNSILKPLQDEFKDVKVIPRYDEPLTHLIIAACDIILCPSFDDPLLQVPLKAIKYGSAPISLSSVTDDFRNLNRQSEGHDQGSTNVSRYILSTFGEMSLSQALTEFKNDPGRWEWRMKDGMAKDFSWDAECLDIHFSAYSFVQNL
ncbi:Glycogen synthase [Rhynchospora pubera]|uniref:starch synthase n=1 Tax=Rhynchospora pubera TaxID=906938 RepID=A0AAV8E5H4_9POAL|nr:Glycogen synthase [Rhynchospora pubera]